MKMTVKRKELAELLALISHWITEFMIKPTCLVDFFNSIIKLKDKELKKKASNQQHLSWLPEPTNSCYLSKGSLTVGQPIKENKDAFLLFFQTSVSFLDLSWLLFASTIYC